MTSSNPTPSDPTRTIGAGRDVSLADAAGTHGRLCRADVRNSRPLMRPRPAREAFTREEWGNILGRPTPRPIPTLPPMLPLKPEGGRRKARILFGVVRPQT